MKPRPTRHSSNKRATKQHSKSKEVPEYKAYWVRNYWPDSGKRSEWRDCTKIEWDFYMSPLNQNIGGSGIYEFMPKLGYISEGATIGKAIKL